MQTTSKQFLVRCESCHKDHVPEVRYETSFTGPYKDMVTDPSAEKIEILNMLALNLPAAQ